MTDDLTRNESSIESLGINGKSVGFVVTFGMGCEICSVSEMVRLNSVNNT